MCRLFEVFMVPFGKSFVWGIYKTFLKDHLKQIKIAISSCHGRCRAPGCFVVFFVFFLFFWLFFLMMAWVGVGSGGMLTFM